MMRGCPGNGAAIFPKDGCSYMVIDDLIRAYDAYASAAEEPRKRPFKEMFKGWFSGKGQDPLPQDDAFMSAVKGCVDRILDKEDDSSASDAVKVILSVPHEKGIFETDLTKLAMHSQALRLIDRLSPDEAASALELLNQVPKCYRFPVQKELAKELEHLAGQGNEVL